MIELLLKRKRLKTIGLWIRKKYYLIFREKSKSESVNWRLKEYINCLKRNNNKGFLQFTIKKEKYCT